MPSAHGRQTSGHQQPSLPRASGGEPLVTALARDAERALPRASGGEPRAGAVATVDRGALPRASGGEPSGDHFADRAASLPFPARAGVNLVTGWHGGRDVSLTANQAGL